MNIEKKQDVTIASFSQPMNCISSALLGGGIKKDVLSVANITLPNNLYIATDLMTDYCRNVMDSFGCEPEKSVALLTSVPQIYTGYSTCGKCFVTAGLGNACSLIPENVWDEKKNEIVIYSPGTINCVIVLEENLSDNALIEGYGIAKVAISEIVRRWSIYTGLSPCFGTPTDCTALICSSEGQKINFAGLGTKIGADIVSMVVDATTNAIFHKYSDFRNLICDI